MIAKVNRNLLEGADGTDAVQPESASANRPVLLVLWRRKWTVTLITMMALAGAGVYLLKATPIFTSSSSVYIEQQGVKIMSDTQGFVTKSDSFLYTQAEILKSAPILASALERVNYRGMKTFQDVDNVVAWMQKEKDFKVEVGKKDDVVTVSLDSPYPQEAAEVVNSVVDAYVNYQSKQKRTTAGEMMKILQQEKKERDAELDTHIQAMLKFKEENGALSFQDNDKGNIILERLATLSNALTTADLNTVDLRTELDAGRQMLRNPQAIRQYVQILQTKDGSTADKSLDDLRTTLQQQNLAKAALAEINGDKSSRVRMLQADIDLTEQQIAEKERQIAEAHVADVTRQVAMAEGRQKQLQAAFDAQKREALKLNAMSSEFARLQGDVERTQRQCDMLDTRIKEINVNSEDAGTLNIQLLQAAVAPDKPSKPRKTLTLAGALLGGLMLGLGLALLRDWMDQRLRTPDDVTSVLGLPIIGVVPHMRGRLNHAARGQMVHRDRMSDVSEAYRTIRTGVFFGTASDVKTILVTSPAPGDGKSTTASNLAIAMAQAGHRTLLLDCDFRKPVQHRNLEIDATTGMSDVINGTAKLRDVIRRAGVPNLFVLPVGPLPSNPSEIMTGKRFAQVMAALTSAFDRVIIDTPPVMAVTDARILAASADASILVVRINKSSRKVSSLAVDSLRNVGANLLGVIVNAMPRSSEGYGYYYSARYYGGSGAPRRPMPSLTGGAVADPATVASEARIGRANGADHHAGTPQGDASIPMIVNQG